MKKILWSSFLLLCTLSFAQNKKIDFTKELIYKANSSKGKSDIEDFKIKVLASNNSEFLTSVKSGGYPINLFSDKLGSSMVNIELNNTLKGNRYGINSYYMGMRGDENNIKTDITKLKTTETILGTKCTNYLLTLKSEYQTEGEGEKIKLCIDDQNKSMNNIPVFIGIINQMGYGSNFKDKLGVQGLILKAGPESDYEEKSIQIVSSKDVNEHVYFNHSKALTDFQKTQDSLILAYKNMEIQDAVDSAAVAVVDSAYAVDADVEYYQPYESTYKQKIDYKDIDLAISNEYNKGQMVSGPKFCTKLNEIPDFENKDIKKHLYNYLGQTCDLYLAENRNHSVAVKITVDQVRHEALYLMEIRDKLSKKDQKQLDKFLNKLD